MVPIEYPHFFDVAAATNEESRTKGYKESGFYFFTDKNETDVMGPFQSFEEAEAARVEHRAKSKLTSVDSGEPAT